jgi:hypothetical protein
MQLGRTEMALGVELIALDSGQFSCRSIALSKKGNAVHIDGSKNLSGTLSTVLASLPKKLPIALTLSGQGIIHKNQAIGEKTVPGQLFSMAFPSIEPKEFYAQEFISDQNALVSIIRKSQVDDVLTKFNGAGLQVYMLSLGGIVTAQIWPQLNFYGKEISFDGHFFNVDEAKAFVSYQYDASFKASFPIKIDQEPIAEHSIVAYATAFQLLLHDKLSPILGDVDSVNDLFTAFNAQQKIKDRAMIFTFALFFLLLVSFLTFVHYNQQNAALAGKLGSITATSDQLGTMKDNIAAHKTLLKALNWNGGYNYGFLVNEVGASLPKQLKLDAIFANEFKTEEEKNRNVPILRIVGTTSNLTAVNNWIFVLKQKSWVKSIKLEKYQEELDTENYQFHLLLTY